MSVFSPNQIIVAVKNSDSETSQDMYKSCMVTKYISQRSEFFMAFNGRACTDLLTLGTIFFVRNTETN